MAPARRPAVTVAAIAAAVAASLAGTAVALWCTHLDHTSIPGAAFNAAVVTTFTIVGAIIAAARPRNAIGWLMLAGGALWSLGGASVDLAFHGIVPAPGSVTGASAYAVGGSAARSVGWYLITILVPVLFPDGRVAGRRWRWLIPASIVIIVGAVVDPLTDPQADLNGFGSWQNPIAATGLGRLSSAAAFLAHIPPARVVTVAAVAQLVSRWRRGGPLLRQQLLLFAAAVALTLVAVPVAFGLGAGSWIFGAAALPIPVAIGFAVLARGLYDLRTAANRTLVWLTLSAVVAGLYALVIVGLSGVADVHRGVAWLAWVATAVIAVSFAPLRDSLQRAVNRITYGRWVEPYDVLASLGQRLEGTADVERLLGDVVTELTGLGLQDVAIRDAGGRVVAGTVDAAGERPEDDVETPLSAYGEPVGTLTYRRPAGSLRSRDRQLLDDLAGHLGGVLHAQRLTDELRLAREQLVLAREEERRRLRRDLHDGLGPALAGHLLRLDVIAARTGQGSTAAADIDSLRGDLRGTVNEVRRVVEGLRPPALDELGLPGALDQAAQRLSAGTSTAVTMTTGPLPALSAAVEVAAFRIVTEALTNVVRHAQASSARVEISAQEGWLRLSIEDDGCGLPRRRDTLSGNGMQTMRERAEELRGHLRVDDPARSGRGTRVVAELPLPTERAQPVASAAPGVTR
jgi:signal transduction histidine kinase